jgi:hypothetical protein
MAPLVTHLVVGERVFTQLQRLDDGSYGSFLLGCLLVDVNHFGDVDRRRMHFIGGLEKDGADALNEGCANFLSRLDGLLLRPWRALTGKEQAFVAGYLCHLAADEVWKWLSWHMLRALGIRSLAELPVPGEVVMTVFSVLSSEMFLDFAAVVSALKDVSVPNVLAHVSHDVLRQMWGVVKGPMLNGRTRESYFEMLRRKGKTRAEIEAARHQHDVHWDDAVALIHDIGGVEPGVQAGVRRSLETVPLLWAVPQT